MILRSIVYRLCRMTLSDYRWAHRDVTVFLFFALTNLMRISLVQLASLERSYLCDSSIMSVLFTCKCIMFIIWCYILNSFWGLKTFLNLNTLFQKIKNKKREHLIKFKILARWDLIHVNSWKYSIWVFRTIFHKK